MNISYPKISIVTPSYNQGQYLEETILSVIGQNYPTLDYIIIDGGSTDNSVEIIKKYEKYLAYWVSEPDKGQSDAINKGFAKCRGEVFNWLNSDDYLESGSLFHIGEAFLDKDIEVFCGYLRQFRDTNNETVYTYRVELDENCFEANLVNHLICQPATFYKKQILEDLGGLDYRLNYTMDLDLWLKYLTHYGLRNIKTTEKLLAHFRLHDTSKTIAQQEKFALDMDAIEYSMLKSLKANKAVLKYAAKKKKNPIYEFQWKNTLIKRKKYIELWCLRQLKFVGKSLTTQDKLMLLFYYIRLRPFKSLKEYKVLLCDYLFPKVYKNFSPNRIKKDLT